MSYRQITIASAKRFVYIPVWRDGEKHRVRFVCGGIVVRTAELFIGEGEPLFESVTEIGECIGKSLTVEVMGEYAERLTLRSSDEFERVTDQKRAHLSFTPMRGWNNDPNGLFYDGEKWQLFYQHNPYGIRWNNMTWGHAISYDLVHWEELPDALWQDERGMMFSGSAVLDKENVSGFGKEGKPPVLLFYTNSSVDAFHVTDQYIAYSTDGCRTFTKEQRPLTGVLSNCMRDPKVEYCPETGKWLMPLYDDIGSQFSIWESDNLCDWSKLQSLELPGSAECPGLFRLPYKSGYKWVFWGADSTYIVGSMTQSGFKAETAPRRLYSTGYAYAAQTFHNTGERVLQLSWLRMPYGGGISNCSMSIPEELYLREYDGEPRLCIRPAAEFSILEGCAETVKIDGTYTHTLGLPAKIELKGKLSSDEAVLNLCGRSIHIKYGMLRADSCDIKAFDGDFSDKPFSLEGCKDCVLLTAVIDVNGMELYSEPGYAAFPHDGTGSLSISGFDGELVITTPDSIL